MVIKVKAKRGRRRVGMEWINIYVTYSAPSETHHIAHAVLAVFHA